MEIKIKIDLDDMKAIKDIVALKLLSEGLEKFGHLSPLVAEKIEKIFLIKEYLDGGLRTPPTNSRIPRRIRAVCNALTGSWIRDTKNEWRESNGNDVRIEMYRLEELDDIINSENDIMIKHFIEQIWLDTVMDGDIPWLILDAIKLESLREIKTGMTLGEIMFEELMNDIENVTVLLNESTDRKIEIDTIQEISVPISDDETSGVLFG